MAWLAAGSIFLTLAFLLAYRFTVNHRALRRAKDRAQAGLLELRIFAEEPRIVGRALGRIVASNLKAAALMLPALAVMLPCGWFAIAYLEARCGNAPLQPGTPALVTVQLRGGIPPDEPPPVLEAPSGFRVDSPAVRAVADRQIAWRIRPVAAASGELRVRWPGFEITKRVQAGRGGAIAARRSRSFGGWMEEPVESRLPAGPAEWIEVRYPAGAVAGLPWEIWFVLISGASWLVLRRVPGLRVPE